MDIVILSVPQEPQRRQFADVPRLPRLHIVANPQEKAVTVFGYYLHGFKDKG